MEQEDKVVDETVSPASRVFQSWPLSVRFLFIYWCAAFVTYLYVFLSHDDSLLTIFGLAVSLWAAVGICFRWKWTFWPGAYFSYSAAYVSAKALYFQLANSGRHRVFSVFLVSITSMAALTYFTHSAVAHFRFRKEALIRILNLVVLSLFLSAAFVLDFPQPRGFKGAAMHVLGSCYWMLLIIALVSWSIRRQPASEPRSELGDYLRPINYPIFLAGLFGLSLGTGFYTVLYVVGRMTVALSSERIRDLWVLFLASGFTAAALTLWIFYRRWISGQSPSIRLGLALGCWLMPAALLAVIAMACK